MIRAIIVDDEFHSREQIRKIVTTFCPNVMVLAAADRVKSGVAAINEHEPEIGRAHV